MVVIQTKEFLVLGRTLYPAIGRPEDCNLSVAGAKEDLKPQHVTPQMLLAGFNFCVEGCGKCQITLA